MDLRAGYSTSDDDLLESFYAPALRLATFYDRAVGYFSSGLLALAPLAFADFVEGGGAIRLVCSPHLSAPDAMRLDVDFNPRASRREAAVNLRSLVQSDDLAAALTQAMSSLLATGALTIKFAWYREAGLFHDKVGLLRDSCDHNVSFVGSANETAAAWSGYINHEHIETFASWESLEQNDRVLRHRRQFDEIWLDLARGVSVEDASSSAALIYETTAPESPEVSLSRLRKLVGDRRISGSRRIHHRRALRPHQLTVLDSWRAAGHRGIVAFATGGGKTLTAIEAIREWTQAGRPAVVLVPSSLLHAQWATELRRELPDVPLVLAGAGARRPTWLANLAAATDPDPALGGRIVLSTYATATSRDFRTRLREGAQLLVVADEVHRMGAPDARGLCEIDSGARLALSATPERYGDPVGTAAIFEYFGAILEPPFGIHEAIEAGQLVPYDYFLETVSLTDDELDKWNALSARLAQEIARNDGAMSDYGLVLSRDRARILKSASAKAGKAAEILETRYRPGDRWLVYCDSLAHLKSVRQIVEGHGHPVYEYHSWNSELGNEIFRHFERGGILLAIRCLDEGVDLPFINRALILASTTNPREYIQRRGRVLRPAPQKTYAQVVDVAVVDDEGELLSLSEAKRALEFAEDASNAAGMLRLQTLIRRSQDADRWRREDAPMETDPQLEEVDG